MTVAVVLELHVLVDQGKFMWFAIQHCDISMYKMYVLWFYCNVLYIEILSLGVGGKPGTPDHPD